jgi:HAD superfamily hydrolase (TIGR01509 family)
MTDEDTAMLRTTDAVAFDCDGTIADTESLSEIAWSEVLRSRGVEWTSADFHALVGRPFAVNWAHFSARGDLGDEATFRGELRARFRALFDEGLDVHDDAVEVMAAAAHGGFGIAVVSSSTRDHIERVLDRAGVTALVDHIVASGDTDAHKPEPDPYLAACRLLGTAPARTVGIEDTPTGVRSSRSAGLWTVAVRRAHAVPELADHADVVVDRLTAADLSIARRHVGGMEQEH